MVGELMSLTGQYHCLLPDQDRSECPKGPQGIFRLKPKESSQTVSIYSMNVLLPWLLLPTFLSISLQGNPSAAGLQTAYQ